VSRRELPCTLPLLLALGLLLAAGPARCARPAAENSQNSPAEVPGALPAEPLRAGEGLALTLADGRIQGFGDIQRVAPMGSLAKLLWLRLEGDAWMNQGMEFQCRGLWRGFHCWKRDGHGAVDLAKALQQSCNLAFLAWAEESLQRDRRQFGEDLTRARLEAVFQPFWGDRVRPEAPLPMLGPAWVGDGDLLQTSPEAFLRWLLAPAQAQLLAQARRLLIPSHVPERRWWMKTGTAPTRHRGSTCAWVAGSDGTRTAVLHLPTGRGKAEGLARFHQLLGIPGPEVP